MGKLVNRKTYLTINDFLIKIGKTKKQMYNLVHLREWYNGFVLRKPNGKRTWEIACYEEYLEWVEK